MSIQIAYMRPQLSRLMGEPLAHCATGEDVGRIGSCVYAVRHRRHINDEIKIGKTDGYLRDRLSRAASQLCYGYANPADLEVVCVIACRDNDTPKIVDQAIRHALREVNVRAGRGREWYLVSDDVLVGQMCDLVRTGDIADYAPSRLPRHRMAIDPLAAGIRALLRIGDAPLQIPTCFGDYGKIEDLHVQLGWVAVTSTVCLTWQHYGSDNGRCRYDYLDLPDADATSGHLTSYVRGIWRKRSTETDKHAPAVSQRVRIIEYLVPEERDGGIVLNLRDIACRPVSYA